MWPPARTGRVIPRRGTTAQAGERNDPTGPGKLLFAFFAAMVETERENIRVSTLEGLPHRLRGLAQ